LLDEVSLLIDESLLQQTEQEAEEPRLAMLETIREYGREKLDASGETESTRQAHALYYLSLAEDAEIEIGGARQAAWLERLEREHDNLRAALQWSLEQAADEGSKAARNKEAALRLGGALRNFWIVHGHISEDATSWIAHWRHAETSMQLSRPRHSSSQRIWLSTRATITVPRCCVKTALRCTEHSKTSWG